MSDRLRAHQVAIVTSTRYPHFDDHESDDHLRGTLALEMLKEAHLRHHPIFVIDEHSSVQFLHRLRAMGITTRMQFEKGMSRGRQQGFQVAFESSSVIEAVQWLEPEKVSYIKEGGLETCMAAMEQDTMIIVPGRSPSSFETLPLFQQQTESAGNAAFMRLLRTRWGKIDDLDVFFGPRLFRRHVWPIFMQRHRLRRNDPGIIQLRPETYSDAIFFPIAYTLKAGFKVRSVEVTYKHPSIQTAAETGNKEYEQKRIMQRDQINRELFELLELMHGRSSAIERVS